MPLPKERSERIEWSEVGFNVLAKFLDFAPEDHLAKLKFYEFATQAARNMFGFDVEKLMGVCKKYSELKKNYPAPEPKQQAELDAAFVQAVAARALLMVVHKQQVEL